MSSEPTRRAPLQAAFDHGRPGENGSFAIRGTQHGPTWQLADGKIVTSPDGLALQTESQLVECIRAQQQHAETSGHACRWTVYSHDPGELDSLLPTAGFTLAEEATLVCNFTADVASATDSNPRASERLTDAADIREAAMLLSVLGSAAGLWTRDPDELQGRFETLLHSDGSAALFAVRIDTTIAATGLVQVVDATDRAWLHGAATAPAYRQQGLFTQLVIDRARFAAEHNVTLLAAEASTHSRTPLLALGFEEIANSHTYVWTPPGKAATPASSLADGH